MTSLTTVTTNIDHGATDTEHYTYNARGAISSSEYKLYNTIVGTQQVIVDYDEFGNPVFETVIIWEYPQGTPWLGTAYTYDKAGRLQKTVEDLDVYTTETTGHFYNGMEQPGCMGEQLRSNDQSVRKIQGSTTTKYIYSGRELLFTTDGNNAKITENILAPNGQVIASLVAWASNEFLGIHDQPCP